MMWLRTFFLRRRPKPAVQVATWTKAIEVTFAPKPRVRIRQDGWITHPRGQPFPFHPKTIVETIMQGGLTLTGQNADYADYWPVQFWIGEAISWKHNIIAYRIVEPRGARR